MPPCPMSVPERPRRGLREWEQRITRPRLFWTSVLVFVVLTTVLFFPYVRSVRTTVSDPGDPLLLIWVMEWVERALLHSPGELLSAPMFHPFRDTLAYTDPVVPHALLALPLRLLGAGPVLAYNAVYLASIVATGVLFTLLFLHLTDSPLAALVGAVVATFPSIRLFQLAHIALQVTVFWPLVLLLVHRVVVRPDLRGAVWLALALSAAALGSLYFGLFLAILLPPFALTLWLVTERRSYSALGALAGAAALAGVLLFPVGRVYSRAAAHLSQRRAPGGFSDLSDYVGISPFADLSRWIPARVIRHSSPEWVGGGAALLLPLLLLGVAVALLRRSLKRGEPPPLPPWIRASAPYLVMGCLAMSLSLGPVFTWHGRPVIGNPLAFLNGLPGATSIRDFQRAGFPVAFAGGAVMAIVLGEIGSRLPSVLGGASLLCVLVSAVVPVFSSTLPVYRPPPIRTMGRVYEWIAEQPEPMVLYEAPLPRRGELEPLLYLWTSAFHRKRIVHGFSGYLPFTDAALRDEAIRLYRPDFFAALSGLGATHLLVHTRELASDDGGQKAIAALREARGPDRVAVFGDDEVYRIPFAPIAAPRPPALPARSPEATRGGAMDRSSGDPETASLACTEIGPGTEPLVLYASATTGTSGLTFVAQSELGKLDDALLVETSEDLRQWRPIGHRPLLSTTLAAYVSQPTPVLLTHAVFEEVAGPFLRVSSQKPHRIRVCDTSLDSVPGRKVRSLPAGAFHLGASTNMAELALAADADETTRWHSGAPQRGGEWVDVDFGEPRRVAQVELVLGRSGYDYARKLTVQCLETGERPGPTTELDGAALRFERPGPLQIVPLPGASPCKVLRLKQTGNASDNYWSIAEIRVSVL